MTALQAPKAYQWIASLYFFQSMPYVVVSLIATIFYQQQGIDNAKAALLTSLLVLPWAIKPLFAPSFEKFLTKKRITILTQGLVSLVFFILAITVNHAHFLIISICGFALLALTSSIHDIVSDGVYLINLDEQKQKSYVALRSFFFQMGRLLIKGCLLAALGQLTLYYEFNLWGAFFYCLFAMAFALTLYHGCKIPEIERVSTKVKKSYFAIYKKLIASKQFYPSLLFIFFYNFSEAQVQKIIPLFLLDKGGLNLDLLSVGKIYGLLGSGALMVGIFISGMLLSRYSLASCMKKLTILLLISHLCFLTLTCYPPNIYAIYATILFSQLSYGLANGAYMGYLLSLANQSAYPMSMYTLCTAAMALSYVFFGSFSGLIQQQLGYAHFFLAILLANSLLVFFTYRRMNKHG